MIVKLSKQGADFIKSFEGCRLEAYHGVQMNELVEIVSAAANAGVPVADMDITAHLHVTERKSRPGYTYDESVGNKRVVRLRENV